MLDPPTVAQAIGSTPAIKKAGSRRKAAVKQQKEKGGRAIHLDSGESDAECKTGRRGRPSGSGNYLDGDVKALLNFVEAELPLGQRGWRAVHMRYTKWARLRQRPERALKSLETKYKQLVRVTKPTGSGEIPANVARAQDIELLINERAGTRTLSSSEFDDDGDEANEAIVISSDEETAPANTKVKARVARTSEASTRPSRNARVNRSQELIQNLNKAFDPSTQRARDEDRARHALDHAHYVSLSHQLRDSQATIEALRNQISELQTRAHASETARERAELRMEMMELTLTGQRRSARGFRPQAFSTPPYRRQQIQPAPPDRRNRVKTKRRYEEMHPDGSGFVKWITDTEVDTDTHDSDKENRYAARNFYNHPFRPRSSNTGSTVPSPLRAFSTNQAHDSLTSPNGLIHEAGPDQKTSPAKQQDTTK
jgi:hypothetical protein